MSLFSKLKAVVGVDGALVEIVELEADKVWWNDTVRGTLTLTGGIEDQIVDRLSVRLMRKTWVTARVGHDPYYSYFNETTVATNLQVVAGTSQQYSFEVPVPEFAEPTGQDDTDQPLTWFVQGVARIHHAVDATDEAEVTIHCPAPLGGLAWAMELAAPVTLYQRYLLHWDQPIVCYTFKPTEDGKQTLDGVKLEVQEKDEQVIGTLQIDPQPHSFTAHLRSLSDKDSLHYDVTFPVADLYLDEDGEVRPEVVAHIQEWFKPFLSASSTTSANE